MGSPVGQIQTPPKQSIPEQFMHKNRLQEYAQRSAIPLPVYQTVNEGSQHAPKFRSTVIVDGATYWTVQTFSTRKAAEQEVARVALQSITNKIKDEGCPLIREDTVFCKSILNEYAVKMNIEKPKYVTTQPEGLLPVFVSSLVFNGKSYTGNPGRNKREAEQLAARAVILSILGNSDSRTVLSQIIKSKSKLYAALHYVKLPGMPHTENVPYGGMQNTITNPMSPGNGFALMPAGNTSQQSLVPSSLAIPSAQTGLVLSTTQNPIVQSLPSLPSIQHGIVPATISTPQQTICPNSSALTYAQPGVLPYTANPPHPTVMPNSATLLSGQPAVMPTTGYSPQVTIMPNSPALPSVQPGVITNIAPQQAIMPNPATTVQVAIMPNPAASPSMQPGAPITNNLLCTSTMPQHSIITNSVAFPSGQPPVPTTGHIPQQSTNASPSILPLKTADAQATQEGQPELKKPKEEVIHDLQSNVGGDAPLASSSGCADLLQIVQADACAVPVNSQVAGTTTNSRNKRGRKSKKNKPKKMRTNQN